MTDSHWVTDANAALLTDLYQLTMLQAYWREGMDAEASFSLFCWRLPKRRRYLVAAGLDSVLDFLESARFRSADLDYLASLGQFRPDFLDWLGDWRFTGTVRAVPEGTPLFPLEPLLEITAPIGQAQLVESFVMNQIHLQTLLASKAARLVRAAEGRPVVDFGLRRMHGADAGLKAARAFHIAGIAGSSNVLAGREYGVPVRGTMAHAFVQACDEDYAAFERFSRLYPDTILLVDTFEPLDGVRQVIRLAEERGEDFKVRGIRIDSGDLAALSRQARQMLDAAGLNDLKIFVSGGLDEYRIAELLQDRAPIDAFGVGSAMATSSDAAVLDLAYKLVEYNGEPRLKSSPGKHSLPGRKQLYRRLDGGRASGDLIAGYDEEHEGEALLQPVMAEGRRLPAGRRGLEDCRAHCAAVLAQLPAGVLAIDGGTPYPVGISAALKARQKALVSGHQAHTPSA